MGPRPLGLLSSVTGRLRWRWLLRCTVPALAVFGADVRTLAVRARPAHRRLPPVATVGASTLLLVMLALVITPLQATAEEYVFRGYLMQTVGGWLKHPAWAILLPVPLFAIGHQYDIWGLARCLDLCDLRRLAHLAHGWPRGRDRRAHRQQHRAVHLRCLRSRRPQRHVRQPLRAHLHPRRDGGLFRHRRVAGASGGARPPRDSSQPVELAPMVSTPDPEGPPPSVGASTLGA